MKKSLLTLAALAAITVSSFAEKTTTTTVNVPGVAKSVISTNPPGGGTNTVVQCDQSTGLCYTQTTTTVENSSIRPGDKVEINGTTGDNVPFHVVGGYINISQDANEDGSAIYRFELSPTWNQY